jgi:hypothetical protein
MTDHILICINSPLMTIQACRRLNERDAVGQDQLLAAVEAYMAARNVAPRLLNRQEALDSLRYQKGGSEVPWDVSVCTYSEFTF